MKIEVFYDSLCSWCRVGKVNLHKAIDKLVAAGKIKEEDIEVIFRAYVIYPDYKPEGEDLGQHNRFILIRMMRREPMITI